MGRKKVEAEYREVIIMALLERDGPYCAVCKRRLDRAEIDSTPPRPGDPQTLANLHLVHPACNKKRHRHRYAPLPVL